MKTKELSGIVIRAFGMGILFMTILGQRIHSLGVCECMPAMPDGAPQLS